MKTLYIMRHGTSPAGGEDRLRPLSDSGRKSVAENVQRIPDDEQPAWILVSPAERTRETAEIVADHIGGAEMVICPQFYQGPPEDYCEQVRNIPDDASAVMVVGHNPAVSHLIYTLSGQHVALNPGDIAVVNFDGDWASVRGSKSLQLAAIWQA